MFKNTILITLLIFTMSCGYEPINAKKNRIKGGNFSIGQINFIGDRQINIKIKEKLSNYSNVKKDKHYTLEIESKSLKTTIAKDIKGDPSVFELNDCRTQRNLSEEGRNQAKRIGARFREDGMARVWIYSSQWCRCRKTAGLFDLGTVEDLSILNSFFSTIYGPREANSKIG